MIYLLSWVIKLKSINTNQISPFVSLPFVKAVAECSTKLDQKQGYADYGKDSKRVRQRIHKGYPDNIKQTLRRTKKIKQNRANLSPIKDQGKQRK